MLDHEKATKKEYSFFADNVTLFFKLVDEECSEEYRSILTAAISVIKESDSKLEGLREELKTKDADSKKLTSKYESAKSGLENAKGKLSELSSEIKMLKRSISDLEKLETVIKKDEETIKSFQAKIQTQEGIIQKQKLELGELRDSSKRLEEQIRAELVKQQAAETHARSAAAKPKCPKDIDEFKDYLGYNLESLGIPSNAKYYSILKEHLSNILFNGMPIVVNRKAGVPLIKCIANALVGQSNVKKSLSPLRYPGGKSKIYNKVKKLIEDNALGDRTYVEPFAGGFGLGIALLCDKIVETAILNDVDAHIYHFWYSVFNQTEDLLKLIMDNATSLTITKEVLADTSRGGQSSSQDYRPVIIDSTGKVVLFKAKGTGTDTFHGLRVYSPDNDLIKEITAGIEVDSYYKLSAIYGSLDENGECHRVIIHEVDTDTKPDTHYFTGINLDNGTVAQYGQRSSDFGMMDFTQLDSNGKFYLYGSGWYVNGGTDYWGPCATLVFDGAQMRSVTGSGTIGNADEGFSSSDRMIAAWFGDNSKGTLDLKISVFPKTLLQETKELIAKFADKLTFVGDVNTSADQIKAAVDAPKPVTKITAAQNGYLSLYNQSLAENKKYYYEYEIKPLTEGTENNLNGLKASTATSMSGQPFSSDTYYVKNTYKEDFNDSITNSFFTVGSGIWSRFGAFGANYDSKYENTNDTPITFTVPAGCVAVLSFDYDIYYLSSGHLESAVYIDGERFYTDAAPDANATGETYSNKVWNHYTHFKLLYPGTHTLTCHRYTRNNTASTYIDNLKVEILSPTKQTLAASFIAQSDKSGWISADGTFETPNGNISYGSQVSSYYSGGIPGGVVDYFSPKKYGTMYPSRGEYYQTVPSGYLQKGWCYPYASCYSDDTVEFTIAGYPYKIGEEGTISSGDKVYLRTMTEGTYTHTYKNDAKGNSSWINQWDLITYPNNSQTITDNISFNSSFTEYFFPKESSTGLTNLSVYLPKGEYLLKNFRIYYYENGNKVYLQNEDCQELTDISKWTLSTGLSTSIAVQTEEKTDDEYVKVYKKGEKVLYNIFYDDYEKDPSKTGYWVYSHINWPPDTVHPDAGKVLTAPIDRFYLSGKYTVTHWEVDNTQRAGTVGDSSGYNKESNKVTMTFYVDGEGKAPWVTYIKTSPSIVEYDNSYTIRVGVDDSEKDTLALETSVYLNGSLIKSDNKTGIVADPDGNYPEQSITGLPKAKKGTYQIVCTVSDYSGTGIKSYKFNVIGVSASATVTATSSLKSGYGISATVKTVTENCKVASVIALLPGGSKVSMVCTAGSGDNLTWQFPANTGLYANLYNKKFNTVSRQIFVPVKWPDDSYYSITYFVYDSNGELLTQTASKTYVDGNMYDDDYTVKTE